MTKKIFSLNFLILTAVIVTVLCNDELSLIQQYPVEYQQYLLSINESNFIDDSPIIDKQNDEQTHLSPGNPFLQWLQQIFGFTTPAPIITSSLEPPKDCEECTVCGQTTNRTKIVGGTETGINQYPWIAMLLYSNRFYCGASLITDMHVLAAHCVSGFNHERISVRLLEHNRSTSNETKTITRNVVKVIKHPRYSQTTFNNDIAILKMDKRVKFEGILNPVCMPMKGEWYTGRDATVVGWGTLKEGGDVSNTLQHVTVPIISNTACRRTGYSPARITDNMGDSGGPLHVADEGTNRHRIVGVVSWGEGCAKPNYPGVYARVNRYGTWIRENTIDSCKCTEK